MAQSLVDRVKSFGRKAVLVAALVSVPATTAGCYTQVGTRDEQAASAETYLPPLVDSPIETAGLVQVSETRYADASGGMTLAPQIYRPRSGVQLSFAFGLRNGLSHFYDSDGDGVPDAEDPWPFTYGPYVRTPFGDELVSQPYFFASPWLSHYHTPWNLWLFETPRHRTPYFGFHDYNHRPHISTPWRLPQGWRDHGTPRTFGNPRTDGRGRVVTPPYTPPPVTRTPIMPRAPGLGSGREERPRIPQTDRGRIDRKDVQRTPPPLVRPRIEDRIPESRPRREDVRVLPPDNMPAINPRTQSNMPIYRPPPATRGDRGVMRTPTYETPRSTWQRPPAREAPARSAPPQRQSPPPQNQSRGGDHNGGRHR